MNVLLYISSSRSGDTCPNFCSLCIVESKIARLAGCLLWFARYRLQRYLHGYLLVVWKTTFPSDRKTRISALFRPQTAPAREWKVRMIWFLRGSGVGSRVYYVQDSHLIFTLFVRFRYTSIVQRSRTADGQNERSSQYLRKDSSRRRRTSGQTNYLKCFED